MVVGDIGDMVCWEVEKLGYGAGGVWGMAVVGIRDVGGIWEEVKVPLLANFETTS